MIHIVYIYTQLLGNNKKMNNIQVTPKNFIINTNHIYPPGNDMIFEEYFYINFINSNINTDRVYLPILWTNLYISRNYATQDMSDIQLFLDQLPRDKKYFTIVQWDDGIKNDLKDLDILIFGSGGFGNYPIPLINKPHNKIIRNKEIFASFVGHISGRHKIREKLRDKFTNKEGYLISESLGFGNFKEVMEKSVFSLCPRGYGKTSFRICESLSLGSIPVYIYDDPWIPFNDIINFEDYGILVSENDLDNLDEILKSLSETDIKRKIEVGQDIFNEYYSYDGCYKQILKLL